MESRNNKQLPKVFILIAGVVLTIVGALGLLAFIFAAVTTSGIASTFAFIYTGFNIGFMLFTGIYSLVNKNVKEKSYLILLLAIILTILQLINMFLNPSYWGLLGFLIPSVLFLGSWLNLAQIKAERELKENDL